MDVLTLVKILFGIVIPTGFSIFSIVESLLMLIREFVKVVYAYVMYMWSNLVLSLILWAWWGISNCVRRRAQERAAAAQPAAAAPAGVQLPQVGP